MNKSENGKFNFKSNNTMNKILKICILLFAVMTMPTFTSCGDDKDDNLPTPTAFNVKDAYGTWMCIKSTDKYQGKSVEDLLVGAEITVKSDGTFTSTTASIGKNGTYTIKDNVITAKSDAGSFVVYVSINGDRMTWEGTANNGVSFTYVFQKES